MTADYRNKKQILGAATSMGIHGPSPAIGKAAVGLVAAGCAVADAAWAAAGDAARAAADAGAA